MPATGGVSSVGMPLASNAESTLAPQPAAVDDAQSCVWYNGEAMGDMPSDDWWARAPFDGHSACTFEGLGSGGGECPDVGDVNLSGLGPWTTSTTAVDEYGAQAQQEFLSDYANGAAQTRYDSQTREYVKHNGGHGKFNCQSWSVLDDLVLK